MGGSKDYVAVDKKWVFDLLELRYNQSSGQVLAEMGSQIQNVNRMSQLELGEGGQKPEGIWE